MNQVTFCLAFSNQNFTNMVSSVLLNTGIISINVKDPNDITELLNTKKIDFIFLDFDFADRLSFNFLDALKNNESFLCRV